MKYNINLEIDAVSIYYEVGKDLKFIADCNYYCYTHHNNQYGSFSSEKNIYKILFRQITILETIK